MGVAYGTYGGHDRCIWDFCAKTRWQRNLDDRGADQKDNIKTDPENMGWGGIPMIALGSKQGQQAGDCECGNEPSGSIKYGKFLD
jgi:hypothetical protein